MKKIFKFLIYGVSLFGVTATITYFFSGTRVVDTLTYEQKEFNKLVDSMSNMKSVDGNISLDMKINEDTIHYVSPVKVMLNPNELNLNITGQMNINDGDAFPVEIIQINNINYVNFDDTKIKFTSEDITSLSESIEKIGFSLQEYIKEIEKQIAKFDFAQFTEGLKIVKGNNELCFSSSKLNFLSIFSDNNYNLSKVKIDNFTKNDIIGNMEFTCDTNHQKEITISSPEKENEYLDLGSYKSAINAIADKLVQGNSKTLIKKFSMLDSLKTLKLDGDLKLNITFSIMEIFALDSNYEININKESKVLTASIKNIPLSGLNYELKEEEAGFLDIDVSYEKGTVLVKQKFTINKKELPIISKSYALKNILGDPIQFIFGSLFNFKDKYIKDIKEIGFEIPTPTQLQSLISAFIETTEKKSWELNLDLKSLIESELIEPACTIVFDSKDVSSYINKVSSSIQLKTNLIEVDFSLLTNLNGN